MIVDSHVHVVSDDVERYPLSPSGVGTDWYRTHAVDADALRLELETAGVDAAVLVQAFGPYSTDNRYVLDAADATGLPAVVITTSATELRRLARAHGRIAGVRLFAIDGALRLDDGELWSAATDLGLTVVVATLPDGLPALAAMLTRFPDTAVALDHCGFAGLDALAPLAPFANLHLKVTPAVDIPLDALVAAFGRNRLVWGSDFPQTHDRSYAELVARGCQLAADLPVADRDAFLAGNARRLWWA